ncbi:sensor domain-containing diguanylate cyclase [Billgrantia montanilacus]|uniref:diguanylate cyclase n=1 Tax=Billgrantia montanilacus TaxID=2282305 RepID=A0A368U146_9GAMM|nr:sensor domain-containing diguanylate cyclase [Halomonas montanilacus]RCV90217.1 sensor domain-containing diguanylate cyclase [Halomonas montanilacus]
MRASPLPACLMTGMALALTALVGGLHVIGGTGPVYAVSERVLIGMVALAQLMMLAGWRQSARVVLSMALIPLTVTLLSYILPEYWVSLAAWDRWSRRLTQGLELDAWRPSLLLALSLTLLATACATRARIQLGGPLLMGITVLLLLSQLRFGVASTSTPHVLRYAAGPLEQLALWGLLGGQILAALPGWKARATIVHRALWPSLILVLLALLLWHQQKNFTERELNAQVRSEAQRLADRLTSEINEHQAAMSRFANVWSLFDQVPSQEAWSRQAALYHDDFRYFLNIAFIDRDSHIVHVHPQSNVNRGVIGTRLFDAQPAGRDAVRQALLEQQVGRTDVIELLQGVPGIIHYLPIPRDATHTLGAVAMVVSLPILAETLFNEVDTRRTALVLAEGEQVLASQVPTTPLGPWRFDTLLDVAGQPLRLGVQPDRASLLERHDRYPIASLSIGIALAYLLYLVLYAYGSLARQHRTLHASNAELHREIRTRTELQQEIEWLARHDELTQLPNRRLFLETLKAKGEARPLSILICDIDHFKRINDHYGHLVGDRYLNQLGELGRGVTEAHGGLFARYGGEEFVAYLPETTADQAFLIAETIRLRVKDADLHHHDGSVLTVSIGTVTLVTGPLELDALMQAADDALYRAKAQGRNRVMAAPELATSLS